jgi:hypothetical protein
MGQPNRPYIDYPYNEGGLMCVGIFLGGTKLFYTMKLVSPKDLGFQEQSVGNS